MERFLSHNWAVGLSEDNMHAACRVGRQMTRCHTDNKTHWSRTFLEALKKYQAHPHFLGGHHLKGGGKSLDAQFCGNRIIIRVTTRVCNSVLLSHIFRSSPNFISSLNYNHSPSYISITKQEKPFLSAALHSEVITHLSFPWTSL